MHLAKAFGDKRLDEISTEDVQRLKAALVERAPKTVNNVLTVLSVVLRTAVEWGVIARGAVLNQAAEGAEERSQLLRLRRLRTARGSGSIRSVALLVVLLGGEAGLRCGEMMALEWTDVDFAKRQLTVARSEWKGHVTMPKGGRIRCVPLTRRLTEALREARHLRGPRVLCDLGHDAAIHAPQPGGARCGDSGCWRPAPKRPARPWRNSGGGGNGEARNSAHYSKKVGGGGGSRTRVRKHVVVGLYMRVRF